MTPLALPCKLMIPTKGQAQLNPAQEDFDKDSSAFPLILPFTVFRRPERGGAGTGHAH